MTISSAPDDISSHAGKIGVLLVNLGTPDALGYWPVRRYLKEFLSDRRVVDTPRLIWWPILNLVILSRRPQASSKNYETIWNRELNESPLKTVTRSQAEKLGASIAAGGLGGRLGDDAVVVDWAMRYWRALDPRRLREVESRGLRARARRPALSAICRGDDGERRRQGRRIARQDAMAPAIAQHRALFRRPGLYRRAGGFGARGADATSTSLPEIILVSFHGIPKSYVAQGDPYYDQCLETWRLLRERLQLSPEQMPLSFQSRFGLAEWLQPYTDETVKALARDGVKRMAVLTPGFLPSIASETISEIGIENRDFFIENGGENFALIRCLNDSGPGMKVIQTIVARELQGWIETVGR